MGPRSSSETHLNHPPHSHTLPNGVSLWAAPLNDGPTQGGGDFPQRRVSNESKDLVDSLPRVQHLKSFFEQLNKEGEEDVKRQRTGTISGMKKGQF